ncbi:Helicase associated domain protein [Umezawaea sp. Da 62-37]|uniref:DEAD/DEAH box helicase n=1 Tax=Umezawaea sp. Da 62-37 TaxID=3075927 RepID=UPI0028F7179F|nr:Helicase associated domain protein [Umezawaea sp. Da 62-37]WNV84970.1 Helicase associated domain protein [Umezawaea sp. Da 62-37]
MAQKTLQASTRFSRDTDHPVQQALFPAHEVSSKDTGPAARAMPGILADARDYQVRAVDDIQAGLAAGGRGQMRAACGTGKTKMSLWAALRLVPPGGIVAIVVPTVGLVAQTLAVWKQEHGDYDALAVCSDTSIDEDYFAGTKDILEPITTNADVVDTWLRLPSNAAIRLIVGTHVSAHVVGEGLQLAGVVADLLLVDEAHRTAGRVDKHTAMVHDDEVLPALRRLYMTATPRVQARRSPGEQDTALVSMDDEEVFGKVLFSYPFSQAIADGWLDDYRLAVIGVSQAEVLAVLRDASPPRPGAAVSAEMPSEHTAMVQAALARAAVEFGLRRVIAFCPRIATAREFTDTLPATLESLAPHHRPSRPLHAEHIHGRMKQAHRNTVLAALADPPDDGWAVISNAKCLSEGIDVPAVDCVVFTEARQSVVDIVQGVGRALRRNPDGTGVATILVPILLPDDPGEVDEILDAGRYDVLWQVIVALRAHDEVFGSVLDRCRADRFDGADEVRAKITVDLPGGYDNARFLDHLTIRIVKSATSQWWDGYGHLKRFHESHGHPYPTVDHVVAGYKLGAWVGRCRQQYRQRRLAPDRVHALLDLDFDFDFDRAQAAWMARLAVATSFHAAHGHLDPPSGVLMPDGTDLRAWLGVSRRAFHNGTLTADRGSALDKLGLDWSTPDPWDVLVDKISAFHTEHGHLKASKRDPDPRIAAVATALLRCRGRHRKGKLAAHLVSALDSMGIVWEPNEEAQQAGIAAAERYHARVGHLLPEADYVDETGFALGNWVHKQRQDHQKGKVPDRRRNALDALGMVWQQVFEADWQHRIDIAARFRTHHGHLRVPPKHPPCLDLRGQEWDLHKWINRQRAFRRANRLSEEQIAALDALGIDWAPLDSRWETKLSALRALHARHGSLTPCVDDENYTQMCNLLANLRSAYRADKLDASRVEALEELGIVWDPSETSWRNMIAFLRDCRDRHGTITVPWDTVTPAGVRVHSWMSSQRRLRRDGKLPQERVCVLEELGMQWAEQAHMRRAIAYLADAERYRAHHGHLDVLATDTQPADVNTKALSKWLDWQRECHHNSTASVEHVAALNQLGIDWTGERVKERHWLYTYEIVRQRLATTGTVDVTPDDDDPDSARLATWLKKQRSLKAYGRLAPDRQALLDALNIDWTPDIRGTWTRAIEEVNAYVRQHGSIASVRNGTRTDTGFDLHAWLRRTRNKAARGDLYPSQVEELVQLGVLSPTPHPAESRGESPQ